MSINQSQQLRTQLTIAPALQRSLQLLQMNALEFAQEINESLDRNPLLERDEDASPAAEQGFDGASNGTHGDDASYAVGTLEGDGSAMQDLQQHEPGASDAFDGSSVPEAGENEHFDVQSFDGGSDPGALNGSASRGLGGPDDFTALDLMARQRSLREHLLEQIGGLPLEPLDAALAGLVVDSLDGTGYLRDTADELLQIAQDLLDTDADDPQAEAKSLERGDLDIAIRRVQSLDPPGVAASCVSECLAIQLAALPAATPQRALAQRIVRQHLELLGQGDFRALAAATGADQEALAAATQLIRTLNPKPGLAYATDRIDYAVPEVIVRKNGGRWEARLHPSATPRIRINRAYAAIVSRPGQSQAMADQLNQARWLLRSIEQRANTIERTAQAIVARQQKFFEHGDIGLQPMRLADIAADIGIHESTVSRVVNSKYLQCPRGLISLKRFFTSHVETSAGNTCSATAVKAMIRQLLSGESPAAPISDHRLAKLLEQRGIRIARRTVTKYRDAMGIEAVEMRRHAYRCEPPGQARVLQ